MAERFKRDGRMYTYIPGENSSTTADPETIQMGFNLKPPKRKSKTILDPKIKKSRDGINSALAMRPKPTY